VTDVPHDGVDARERLGVADGVLLSHQVVPVDLQLVLLPVVAGRPLVADHGRIFIAQELRTAVRALPEPVPVLQQEPGGD
jgi:hypothetical protein